MKNEFVKYEQALALKELGFDKPCLAFYSPKEELHPVFQEPSKGPYFNNGSFVETLRAPLYQQAFRWFREVHGLYPEVHLPTIVLVYGNEIVFNAHINHLPKDESIGCFLGKYNTYEEAESACLDKLIEICKNK